MVITSQQSDVTRLLGRRVYGDRHCCLFSKKLVPLNGHSSRRLIKELPLNKLNMLFGSTPPCAPAPCKLTFDILTFKVVSESYVTRATSVPILVFLSLSVLDLGYVCDRQSSDSQRSDAHHRLLVPPTIGAGHNKKVYIRHCTKSVRREPWIARN